MSALIKLLLVPAVVVAFAVGVALAGVGGSDDPEPARATTAPSGSVSTTVSTTDSVPTTTDDGDLSGPCDEAEHANDPRCTGAAPSGRHGDRGRGSDNSGPGSASSGPGSDDSGQSGHGRRGDDR